MKKKKRENHPKETFRAKCQAVYKSRILRVTVFFVFGGILMLSGILISYNNRVSKIPNWSKEGPMIEVACDKPEKSVSIYSLTEEEGKTTLTFFQTDESHEEYCLWVYVGSDAQAPVTWEIDPAVGNVENYELVHFEGGEKAYVKLSKEYRGLTTGTVFKIALGGNMPMAQIILTEQENRVAYRANGIYRPRLPHIMPWNVMAEKYADKGLTDSSGEYYKFLQTGGKEPFGPKLNDEKTYSPDLEIGGSYENISFILQNDLELSVVSPDTTSGSPALWWSVQTFFQPVVQFRDIQWESDVKRNSLIGGVLIGLGINIGSALVDYLRRKKQGVQE